jgi:AbrB family looped-hinge helix DNA binding protein
MLSTVTSKGQVTIPKEIRTLMNIKPKDKVDFVLDGDKVLLKHVKTLKDFRGSVTPKGKGNLKQERSYTRIAKSKMIMKEME